MKRLLVLAIPALFAGGCSTENHLLDPVHTPLVEVSPERPATPPPQQQGAMGPWTWP